MSITRYTRKLRKSSDNYSEKDFVGAAVENTSNVTTFNQTFFHTENDITSSCGNSSKGWLKTQFPYYINTALKFNVGDVFARAAEVDSLDAYATKLMDFVDGRIYSKLKGVVYTHRQAGFNAIENAFLLFDQSTGLTGSATINIFTIVQSPLGTEVEFSINFYIGSMNFTRSTTNFGLPVWNIATSKRIVYSPAYRTTVINSIKELAKINIYVGPSITLNYVSGTSPARYNFQMQPQYTGAICEYKSTTPEEDFGISTHFETAAFAAYSWTGSGTVDPTDPFIDPDDPYDPIVPDDPGPDDPEPIDPDDPIIEPILPPISGVSVGLYKAFRVNSSQLSQIAAKLWDPSAWDAIKQMFTNPMEAIFGLAIIPVLPETGIMENVYLGRYNTGVQALRITSDYVIIDCGTIQIKKFYGSYLDYDPYTRISLYLPYIGEVELNADEIIGKNITIKYHCNVITGDLAAYVIVGSNVMYTGGGNFIRQLPLSQVDYTNIIQTAVSATAAALTLAVAGSGAASISDAIGASNASDVSKISAQSRVSNITANGSTSLLNDVLNAKYHYNHAGKVGQGGGQLNMQKPFIIVSRPNLSLPEGNDASKGSSLRLYTGYPSNKIVSLGDCHGFTQIDSCRLSVPDATDEEIAELYSLLKGGVIF